MSHGHAHLDETRFQALLDGELPAGEAVRLRAEIAECARCTSEFESWELLFGDLSDLPVLAPSVEFSDRILGALPEARPAGAGLTGWMYRPAASTDHLGADRLQDFLDGRLAARTITRVERHLDGCTLCRDELVAHRRVMTALSELPTLAPSKDFGERVMAGVRVRQMVELAMAPVSTRDRIAAWVRKALPTTGQGWAAAMGMLVTPVTLLVLLVRAIFTHELVTVSSLAAFAWLKVSDVIGGSLAGVQQLLLDQSWVRAAVNLVEMSGAGSTVFAASGTVLLFMTMAAAWVLYRNLSSSSFAERSHAHLSF